MCVIRQIAAVWQLSSKICLHISKYLLHFFYSEYYSIYIYVKGIFQMCLPSSISAQMITFLIHNNKLYSLPLHPHDIHQDIKLLYIFFSKIY